MRFIRPSENSIFNCHNPTGIKLITRLRLSLSQLREHKFRHNFQDTLNPIWSCWESIENTTLYLLHCSNYVNERMKLLTNLQNVEENILDRNYSRFSEILLFGDSSFNDVKNTSILNSIIHYILDTKRFDVLRNLWKLQKFIYWAVFIMNWGDLILIRLILVSIYIDYHFV